MLGRTETRTRDRMYCQTMRTVRDISRDNRARIATCSLRTSTDRLKENYSIDGLCMNRVHYLLDVGTLAVLLNLILVECLCRMAAILDLSENRTFAMVACMGVFNCGHE